MAEIPILDPPEPISDLFGLHSPEQDPVAWMHDVEAESGDEQGLLDEYEMDYRAARQIGVALDNSEGEPRLD